MKLNYLNLLLIISIFFSSCKQNEPEREIVHHKETFSNKEKDQKILNEKIAPTEKKLDSLYTILRRKDLEHKYKDSIQKLYTENLEKQEEVYKDFIRENPYSLVSVENLNGFKFRWGKKKTANLFNRLSPAVQDTEDGKMIEKYLNYYSDPKIKDNYIDFKLPDSLGNDILLSKNLGNYTLLEFWASHCAPCRKAHPELVEVFEEYKSKGLEIIGVSVDENQEAWKIAVNKDNLPWINLWDPEGRESKVQYQYGIKKLSTNFLINSDGKIMAIDITPEELEAVLKEI